MARGEVPRFPRPYLAHLLFDDRLPDASGLRRCKILQPLLERENSVELAEAALAAGAKQGHDLLACPPAAVAGCAEGSDVSLGGELPYHLVKGTGVAQEELLLSLLLAVRLVAVGANADAAGCVALRAHRDDFPQQLGALPAGDDEAGVREC